MKVKAGLALSVMLAMAVGSIRQDRLDQMRSLASVRLKPEAAQGSAVTAVGQLWAKLPPKRLILADMVYAAKREGPTEANF